MRINKLHINGYGKLKNKDMEFKDGINIVYGENEIGKSTLLNYITNSLFGISKNKNGKEISDFEKYTPWENEKFSGTLEYTLDNGEKIKIFRDFRKKTPQIFNDKMVDITNQFSKDKERGNEFFYEQTKINEELFKTIFLVGQQEVKLGNTNQQMLVQRISNLIGSGQDSISYKSAIDKLNRKLLNEVGTQKSREKPINVISKKIEELENKKKELCKYDNIKYEIEEKKNNLLEEIRSLKNKKVIFKEVKNEIKKLDEKEILEKEKINLKENLRKENNLKIEELKKEKNEIEKEEKKFSENNKKIKNKIKKLNKIFIIIFLFLILINIILFFILKNKIINVIFLLTLPTALIFWYFLKNKLKNKIKNEKIKEIKSEKNKKENEIEILEENNLKIKSEIEKIKGKNNLENNIEKQKIKSRFRELEIDEIYNSKNIESEIENLQDTINRKMLEVHQCKLDKENIEPQLDNLSEIEERLFTYKEQYVNLINKGKSIELAKNMLTNAYEKMKNEVTPKFTNKLSQNIGIITKGRYSKAMYNEEEGLIVELENGNYVTVNKLSIGTIDQLYLSLRLSIVDELTLEKLPIILDESFAYFDNKRLKNILENINNNYSNRQIIIFTCTNREKNILQEENIKFNYIKM